jgi:hypothetical protein
MTVFRHHGKGTAGGEVFNVDTIEATREVRGDTRVTEAATVVIGRVTRITRTKATKEDIKPQLLKAKTQRRAVRLITSNVSVITLHPSSVDKTYTRNRSKNLKRLRKLRTRRRKPLNKTNLAQKRTSIVLSGAITGWIKRSNKTKLKRRQKKSDK